MQNLIVPVVFHTRRCFELHRGNSNRDLRVEAAKRPEVGAKWREIGGTPYAVSVKVTLKSTQPTHTDTKMRKEREGCVHHVRKH
jgi:hypothetical protein